MLKAILFDVDGVIIKKHDYFSIRYAKDFGKDLNENAISRFFKSDYQLAAVGKADLKQLLAPRSAEWGWKGTVEELMRYWFEGEAAIDREILSYSGHLRNSGIVCCMASDNEAYRAGYLLNDLKLKEHFDFSFFSCYLGVTKSDKEFFEKSMAQLKTEPEEIVYVDDDEKNLQVAETLGINTVLYHDYSQLKEDLDKLT